MMAMVGIAGAAVVAYGPSFSGVFVFDDEPGILRNHSIHHAYSALFPPADSALSGRPVANLSFAINYALSGTRIWSYHALNLLIHILAGLTLFGICRRTFARLRGFASDATLLAGAVALLWTLHPLQTEAVTYVVQRVESLMALFYLLTLYGFVRSVDSTHPRRWRWLAWVACALGAATKEVIVTAPVMVLLYDRTFVAGSIRTAWRERRGFHLALAATWLPLAALVASTGWNRGGTAGFDVGVSPWAYWLTQFHAVARYIGISLWPSPLVFDFPTFWVHRTGDVLPYAIVVLWLLVGTLWALRWRPAVGFLGAWFFAILAPTSVIPGTMQMIADHRMYLPVAAVLVAVTLGAYALFGRRSSLALFVFASAFGWLAAQRNTIYRSAYSLWSDTLAKRSDSDRAHNNLGNILARQGRFIAAIEHFRAAIRLNPRRADTYFNLGNALRQSGHAKQSIEQYQAALRLNGRMVDAETALGEACEDVGNHAAALTHFQRALRLSPSYALAHEQLGIALAKAGRIHDAIPEFEQALRSEPANAAAHENLGNALRAIGRTSEALMQYAAALRLDPKSVEAHHNLANALVQAERMSEAIAQYQEALAGDPRRADIRNDYGMALLIAGRTSDAVAEFEHALRINPDLGDVHFNLAMALQSIGRSAEAASHYAAARKLGVVAAPPSALPGG